MQTMNTAPQRNAAIAAKAPRPAPAPAPAKAKPHGCDCPGFTKAALINGKV